LARLHRQGAKLAPEPPALRHQIPHEPRGTSSETNFARANANEQLRSARLYACNNPRKLAFVVSLGRL